MSAAFWRGRRVLVTGHTGFKGSWLCAWLLRLGALPSGIALAPDSEPNLFSLLRLDREMESAIVDLRDRDATLGALEAQRPETVVHMAAQPIVRVGVRDPYGTFATNVVGYVNLLDAARALADPPSIVCVTSDKVYADLGGDRAFVESDGLGGDDPYSASKACAELVSQAYAHTYAGAISLCTARAGNVIGGGDWSQDRLVPDLVRAAQAGEEPVLRNPESTRPWQHALDALAGYLLLARRLHDDPASARGAWNFGPAEAAMPAVAHVAERVLRELGRDARWQRAEHCDAIERRALSVDSSKARSALGWRSRLTIDDAFDWTARWYARHAAGDSAGSLVAEQIAAYEELGA